MVISRRIRELRDQKGLSPGEIALGAGLTRAYPCQVEHGHEVPSSEIIERLADALDVPVYQIFYSDSEHVLTPWLTPRLTLDDLAQRPPLQIQDKPGFAPKLIVLFSGIASRGHAAVSFAKRISIQRRLAARTRLPRL